MKILRPVNPDKRLPAKTKDENYPHFSASVIVRFVNKNISEQFNALTFAYYNHYNQCWEPALPDDCTFKNHSNIVTEWFEEVEFESLFPDSDAEYFLSKNASNGRIDFSSFHREGQIAAKNYALKKLRS